MILDLEGTLGFIVCMWERSIQEDGSEAEIGFTCTSF